MDWYAPLHPFDITTTTPQCLRYVPELRTALNRYTPSGADQPFLTNALKDTFNLIDGCERELRACVASLFKAVAGVV